MKILLALLGILWGTHALITGRILFIDNYHGVKNIALHSRIEGGAVLITGVLILLTNWVVINNFLIMVLVLIVAIIAFILEIVFKAI